MKKIYLPGLLILILSLFNFTYAQKKGKPAEVLPTEKFASLMCHKGDITMTLNPNKTFDLTIQFYDRKTQQHSGQESVNGTWSKKGKMLTLVTSDKNTITYLLTSSELKIGSNEIEVKTYDFQQSDKEFFGSNYDLVEQEVTDKFLTGQAQQK